MVKVPYFIRVLFPSAIWKVDTDKKVVYLTFDDGPTSDVTEKVLSLLLEYNAKATFFCLGNKVQKHPEIYQKLHKNGHKVGNHSYDHPLGLKTKNKQYFNDILRASELIESKLFRPPYGKMKLGQYLFLKKQYKIVLWDVIPGDYKQNITVSKLVNNVVNNVSSGSVVVLHDNEKCSEVLLKALPIILKELSNQGYLFRSIKV